MVTFISISVVDPCLLYLYQFHCMYLQSKDTPLEFFTASTVIDTFDIVSYFHGPYFKLIETNSLPGQQAALKRLITYLLFALDVDFL